MFSDENLISIIIPFYEGNEYIRKSVTSVIKSSQNCAIHHEIQLLIVNDSPWEPVSLPRLQGVEIIVNKKNCGIHVARKVGITKAKGKYILLLDQDDTIEENFFEDMLTEYEKNPEIDCVVGNANFELLGKPTLLYKYRYSFSILNRKWFYFYDGCQIVSPGQALLKRTSIPKEWMNSRLSVNGADDYMLWVMMLVQKCNFKYIHNIVYNHHYTNHNVSNDTEKMKLSEISVFNILQQHDMISEKECRKVIKRVDFQNKIRERSSMRSRVLLGITNISIIVSYLIVKILRLR